MSLDTETEFRVEGLGFNRVEPMMFTSYICSPISSSRGQVQGLRIQGLRIPGLRV